MEEMITITKKEYDDMKQQIRWLEALESAGVDNWEGMAQASEIYNH